jgi:hypothetical protein
VAFSEVSQNAREAGYPPLVVFCHCRNHELRENRSVCCHDDLGEG